MEPMKILIAQLKDIFVTFVELLPELAVAALVLTMAWIVTRVFSYVYRRAASRTNLRRSLVEVIQKITSIGIWVIAFLIAATIVFPNLTPAKLLAALGLGSIAIGLAFKDIFENFLAGILILLREPMRLNDYIECESVEGFVENITIRDTYIRKTDGQLVLVPNAMLYKNPVFVMTDKDKRRTTIICGIGYGADIDEARRVITSAVSGAEGVRDSDPVQVFAQNFGASSVDFEVTWWTGSKPYDIRKSRDMVIAEIKRALDEAGIEIPFPQRTLTFGESLTLKRD